MTTFPRSTPSATIDIVIPPPPPSSSPAAVTLTGGGSVTGHTTPTVLPEMSAPTSRPIPDQTSPGPPPPSGPPQRTSSRSHSRSPHRYRHHRRRRFRFKEKERNFLAAVCSMMVIVTLCTALAEPNWFYVRGGGCRDKNTKTLHTLGVYQFFYMGHFEEESNSQPRTLTYHYSSSADDVLVNCVTPRVVQVMRSVIALCFVGIMFSLMAFFLDLAGPSDRMMKILRRNAVFNILTVVVCVTINGFCFLITQLLESLQIATKQHRYSKIDVRFDVSFYLVAAAGGMSVIAAACNLLRRYPPHDHSPDQREALLDDYEGMDIGPLHSSDLYAPMNYMPPPPAYSP